MPRKIRQLKAELRKAECVWQPGNGSHTVWGHTLVPDTITLAGNDGDDARDYQERDVRDLLDKVRKHGGKHEPRHRSPRTLLHGHPMVSAGRCLCRHRPRAARLPHARRDVRGGDPPGAGGHRQLDRGKPCLGTSDPGAPHGGRGVMPRNNIEAQILRWLVHAACHEPEGDHPRADLW